MSAAAQLGSRKKLVHHLDTPFSVVAWPELSLDDQDTILELLCNLLKPLGQHRRAHTSPSKWKRASRRHANRRPDSQLPCSMPTPKPELCKWVDVGFNSITRRLQELSRADQEPRGQPYSMVFVARGSQSSAFNCHFPKMVGVASKHSPQGEKTRLVGFSKPCSAKLSSSLGIARVSSVAVARDAPGAEALWAFVQETVAPIDVSWLNDVGGTKYRSTKISSVETIVGSKRVRTV